MPRPDRIMENNNHTHNNGSGFLLGVIVGVILTLLLTTKKGREILKEVLEKGIERFANLEDLMRETYNEVDEDLEDGDDFIPTESVREIEPPVKKETKKKEVKSEPEEPEPEPEPELEIETPPPAKVVEEKPIEKPKNKRWFRGLRKKN